MTLTSELIDERIKFCREYEKDNLGIKHGPDFAEIARVLMGSKEFESVALVCAAMGIIPMIGRKDRLDQPPDQFCKEMSSGTKEPLAMMFYIGYRLGRAEAEGAQLEKLGNL